ncbi:hypothetical protein GCM10009828_013320 [Actinoplanes couchii]|uniref:Uncharacterized protein n=2 Tax=Actinoplanes couchii TaxID=403638 RepID=A0ABQ3XJG3_9ACTN|nr:hypothetical protein Aco03nite_070430 [Actinoplanes couchii]
MTALGLCGFVLGAPLLDGGAASADFPALVTAIPSAAAEEPEPDPNLEIPDDDGAAIVTKAPGRRFPSRTSVGSARNGRDLTASRPARTGRKEPRRGTRRTDGPRPVTSARTATTAPARTVPSADVGATFKIKPKARARHSGGTGDRAPVFAGMPPGGRAATLPGASDGTPGSQPGIAETDYVAALGLEPETAAPAAGPSAPGAHGPVAVTGPIPDERPVGLLAMTAVVCVLGVGTAAIRAIVSQRASRANMA